LENLVVKLDECEKDSRCLIDQQSMSLEHHRQKLLEQHALILKMQTRLEALDPVKCSTPQPAFGRSR